ncbi:MAG: hypothetical protein JNK45_02825 [Myxococcales bacterium]|nr:hypothetical protein [Myxococcales bacterium]
MSPAAPTTIDDSTRSPHLHRWLLAWAGLGCVWALYAAWPFTTDDAFITLRYARHWADGDGIRWNVGELERVEGYSNFLFVALAAAALRLGLDPMAVLALTSSAALLACGPLLYGIARRTTGPLSACVPVVLLWGYPFTQWWTVSGLETAVYMLAVVAATAAFVRGCADGASGRPWSRPYLRLAGLLGFIAALVRPEGPLVVIAMVTTIGAGAIRATRAAPSSRAARRAHLDAARHLLVAFAVPFAIYLAWRLGHFGHLLPNPVRCKAAYAGSPWALLLPFAPLAALTLGLAAPAWRAWTRPPMLVCTVLALEYAVVLFGVDPTIAYGNRHLLAAYALLGIPAAMGVHHLGRTHGRRTEVRIVVGLAALVTAAWLGFGVVDRLAREAATYAARAAARADVAAHLRTRLGPGDTIVLGDVGVIGDALPDVAILDVYCLNNPAMTRAPLKGSAAAVAEAVLAAEPAAIIVSSRSAETCAPRAKVFRLVLEAPEFAAYELTAVFGADADEFHYWIYERRRSAM